MDLATLTELVMLEIKVKSAITHVFGSLNASMNLFEVQRDC